MLDLQKTGGGLTPVRVVGQAQGLGLAFKGADGKAYTFRSLHKHPERMLPEEWRDRLPAKIAQDQSSHTHPAAGQILTPLQEAAGVAHTNPRLVVVPDDPALGEFRKTFAGEFGTIDEFPLPAAEGRPGFMGRDRDRLHHRSVEAMAPGAGEPDRQPGVPPGRVRSTSGWTTSTATADSGAGCAFPGTSSTSRCPRTRTWSSSTTTGC